MANMLYDMAAGPPPHGSLQGFLFRMIAKRRQEAKVLSVMYLAAIAAGVAAGDTDHARKVGEDFLSVSLPYLERSREEKQKASRRQLDQWVGKGPMKVFPMMQPRVRRKGALT